MFYICFMKMILFHFGSMPVTGELALLAAALIGLALLLITALGVMRLAKSRARADAQSSQHTHQLEAQISALLKTQAEMTGRMQTMAEVFGGRQSDLMRAVNERLDGMGHKLGQSMADTSRRTHEGLRHLHERLAVIDRAQHTISDLSGQVLELQAILSNKQSRGAFGQGRMEAIVQDALPSTQYSFQASLSSGARPDCLVKMPNGAPPLAIDAKFPLEAFNLIRAARNPEEEKAARRQFRRDMLKHVQDIKERYLIPGETQDTAFMFVPSESVFAELNENFEDVVQKSHRLRVVIVSPALLLLSVQVIQSVLRDARMREQAHLIQTEVAHFMLDLNRLDERVGKLKTHFAQTTRDIDQISTSTEKLGKRGQRIESLQLGEAEPAPLEGGERHRGNGADDDEVLRAPIKPLRRRAETNVHER